MTEPPRIKTIKAELDKTANEYLEAKNNFEVARITFEAARERYSGLKEHASSILDSNDWYYWQKKHADVKYAATQIGNAIGDVLWNHAFDSAWTSVRDPKHSKFSPAMSLGDISIALENGGFDFRTSTPMREVNAALIHLKDVEKIPSGGYQIENAKDLYEDLKKDFLASGEEG